MSDACNIRASIDKEPWLAVSLSWLVPGAGQLYIGSWPRALLFLGFGAILHTFWLIALISAFVSPVWLPLFWGCTALAFPAIACIDAYEGARGRNAEDFEKKRALAKDPWLIIFFSLLLPGAGHAYIRKIGFCLLYLVAFLGVYYLSGIYTPVLVIEMTLYVVVCLHAYRASRIYRQIRVDRLTLLLLFMVAIRCFGNLVLPTLYSYSLFEVGSGLGPSMSPTFQEGDQVIVNKLVYHLISPKVGDIVCFTLPDQAAYHFEDPISGAMKRVAAIGGETVQVTNGLILVNGTRRDFNIRADASPPSRADTNIYSFGENENPYLTYGVHQPYLVPEGHYFLLGDNLSHSADSRSFGAIDQRSITGKAVKICWPFHRIANVR